MGGLGHRYLEMGCCVRVRSEPRGYFPLFWRVVKTEIPAYRNSLVVEKCWEFGVNFQASKLEKTLFRFLTRISYLILHNFLGKFEGSNQGLNTTSSAELLGPVQISGR